MDEQWNNALDQVEDAYLLEAVRYRRKRRWPGVVAAVAAVLVLAVGWSVFRPQVPSEDPPGRGSMPSTNPPEQVAPGCAAGGGLWDSLLGGATSGNKGEPCDGVVGTQDSAQTYKVTVAGEVAIENALKPRYAAGEQVTVKLATVTEHFYILYVNGTEQAMDMDASDLTYTCFTFTMPAEDVLIEIEDKWVDIPTAP